MSIRPEDTTLIKMLEERLIEELDRQHMDNEIEEDSTGSAYFDATSGELTGIPNWYKAITKVMETYWEEEGR